MALKFFDGFEMWDDPLKTGWNILHADPPHPLGLFNYADVVTTMKRTGNRCLRLTCRDKSLTTNSNAKVYAVKYIDSTSNKIIMGFGIYFTNIEETKWNNGFFLKISDLNKTHWITLSIENGSHRLVLKRDESTIGMTDLNLSINTWYFFQIKYTAHQTNGMFELLIDNQQWLLYQGNLETNGNNNVNYILFGCDSNDEYPHGSTIYIDDVWILDGDPPLNFYLGDCRIYPMVPQNVGSDFDFTLFGTTDATDAVIKYNLSNMNKFIYGNNMNDTAFYQLGVTDTSYIVGGISILSVSQRGPESVGFIRSQVVHKYGVSENVVSEYDVFSDPTYNLTYLLTNPTSSSPWLIDELEDSEFGIRISKID